MNSLIQRINELKEELHYFASVYGCNCGHPYCSSCNDTKDAMDLIKKDDEKGEKL